MKNVFFLIMFLSAISCVDSKSNKEDESRVFQAEKPAVLSESIDSIPNQRSGFSETTLKKINHCLKIDYEIESKEILDHEEIDVGEKKLYLVKLEPKVPIKALGNDPIANLVVLYDEHYYYINIPSVYSDDFNLLDKRQDLVIFEYYSSPVGYTQLIIIDLNSSKLFFSDKILETEELILESINLSKNEFKVNDEKGNELKKRFKSSRWLSC